MEKWVRSSESVGGPPPPPPHVVGFGRHRPPTRGNLGGSGTRQPANHRVDRKTRPRHL